MKLLGPILIVIGVSVFAFVIYKFMFAPRDKRSSRQKNLDAIAEMRGDKHPPKGGAKAAKKHA
jgi:hypothetical protein